MSKYTMELRKLKDDFFQNMQDYPIFEESYRSGLNEKIFRACKFREIGFETPELFFEELREWMDLNMQEYNYLYKSLLVELTPLQRVKIQETYNGLEKSNHKIDTTTEEKTKKRDIENNNSNVDIKGENKTNGKENSQVDTTGSNRTVNNTNNTNTNDTKTFNSDFPQANLQDEGVDSNYYSNGSKTNSNEVDTTDATTTGENTEKVINNSNVENTAENKQNQSSIYNGSKNSEKEDELSSKEVGNNLKDKNYIITRTGNVGKTDFEILEEYRKSFMNVDRRLITALKKELFMNIW